MREANDRGYECLLVEDGTESYFPEFKKATLEMVRAQGGIVGWTATTAQIYRRWRERSRFFRCGTHFGSIRYHDEYHS